MLSRTLPSHLLFIMHIPSVNFLNNTYTHEEWSLHLEVMKDLCHWWEMPKVNFQAQQQTEQVCVKVKGIYSGVLWDQYTLIYAFPSLKLLPSLVHRIEMEDN